MRGYRFAYRWTITVHKVEDPGWDSRLIEHLCKKTG
jgi:hypothetical protein